jgi:hypothetical protein
LITRGSIRWLQRNPEPGAHVLEYHSNGFDDQLVRIGLAIDNDLVLRLFRPADIEVVLFGETIVPAAVLAREQVGIILEGACQLQAGQLLDVQSALRVGICAQIDLSTRRG